MVIDVCLNQANIEKYKERKSNIKGIGRVTGDDLFIEYIGSNGSLNVIKVLADGTVLHQCEAMKNPNYRQTGCWHLAAAAELLGANPGDTIRVKEANPLPEKATEDLTPLIIGKKGEFTLAEENQPSSELSLDSYKLPERLKEKVFLFRERQGKRLTPEQKARIPSLNYIPSGTEVAKAVSALLYDDGWEAPLLIGPRGTGKSTMAESLASILHLPVTKIFGGIDLNCEALLGSKTLSPQEGIDPITEAKLRVAARKANIDPEFLVEKLKGAHLHVEFEPGILLQAVLNGEMVIVDEVNMLIPEVTSLLHGLLDWQKILAVPGYGQVKAPESFRMVACMNLNYAGTKALNESFQDRFRSIKVPYLPKDQMADLLQEYTKPEIALLLADIFVGLSDRMENGDISDRCLSFRSLIRAAREYNDELGDLKEIVVSNLTEGLEDEFEASQVRDMVEARIREG